MATTTPPFTLADYLAYDPGGRSLSGGRFYRQRLDLLTHPTDPNPDRRPGI